MVVSKLDPESSNHLWRRIARLTPVVFALVAIAAVPTTPAAGLQASDVDHESGVDVPPAALEASSPAIGWQALITNDTNESEQFNVSADVVARCGSRCRTVSANVTNIGDENVTNVLVDARMYAGDATIWNQTAWLGDIARNESVKRTTNVTVGFGDVLHIDRNDGWITIDTVVRWDGGVARFTERVQVR